MVRTEKARKTKTMKVYLEVETLPSHITIMWENFEVTQYIEKPWQCFNCQDFGHLAKNCKKRPKCVLCAGTHKFSECTKQNIEIKCSNCGYNHTASYGGCIKMKEQKQIQKIKAVQSISYRDAVAQYKAKTTVSSSSPSIQQQTKQSNTSQIIPLVKQTKEIATQTEIPTELTDQSTSTLTANSNNVDNIINGSEMKMATCLLEIISSIGRADSLNKKCATITRAFQSYLGVKLDQKSILSEFKNRDISGSPEIQPSPIIKTSTRNSKEPLNHQNRKI